MAADGAICRMCGLVVTSKNRVKSHEISNSVSYRLIKSKVGEYRMGVDGNARAFNADQSGITEKNVFCRKCSESLSAYEDERKVF